MRILTPLSLRPGWAGLLLALAVVVAPSAVSQSPIPPAARADAAAATVPGVLDLAGEWRWATGEGEGRSAGRFDDADWRRIDLPGGGSELGSHDGPVWLRRSVGIPGGVERMAPNGLGLLVGEGWTGRIEFYAGGRRVAWPQDGGRLRPTPQRIPLPADAVDPEGQLTLALVFESGPEPPPGIVRGGPFGETVLVGDWNALGDRLEGLRLERGRRAFPFGLLAAVIAVAGLYHLQLFTFRRHQVHHFWFSCLVLTGVATTVVRGDSGALIGDLGTYERLLAALSHLATALTFQMVRVLGPESAPAGRWQRFAQGSHAVLAGVALLSPWTAWLAPTRALRWGWILVVLLSLLRPLVRELSSGARTRRWIVAGALLFVGIFVFEAMLRVVGGPGWAWPLSAGFALLGITLAVAASDQFSRVQRDLDELRLRLEQRVEDGTEELAQANRKLRSEIAERQLVEEAMRMLERAVEQSADGMVVTDLSGSTHFLNEAWARMHGHDVYDVLGYEISLFHTQEQMTKEVYPLMVQVRDQGSFQGEVGHRRKDGSEFPAFMSVTRLQDENGAPVGMVAIARDTTGRREEASRQLKLERRAQQAEKLESLAALASGIAHDYNNLLTGLLGNTGLLLRELDETDDSGNRLRQIEGAAERAARLSDQLLSYAGEERIQVEPHDLSQLIVDHQALLRQLLPEGVSLELQIKEGLPLVGLDGRQIRRILHALVSNAVEALGADHGVITLRTSQVDADQTYLEGSFPTLEAQAGSYVFFEVSDSGVGIDEQTRLRIFDPFFSTKDAGRGLGLAAVLGIVRAHGGAIKVYSQIDRGTTFEVLFPVPQALPTVQPMAREVEGWRGSGTILVVDDEELVREVAQDILEGQGFEVVSANDGEEAVTLFGQRREDIRAVLLDLTMPNMDGEEAFRSIRAIDPQATVILMSGYSQRQARERLEDAGLAGFLHKPFRPTDLLRLLQGLLNPDATSDA